MPNILAVNLHPLGVEGTSGTGVTVDLGVGRSALVLRGNVAQLSANASLGVDVETSPDGSTWRHARTVSAVAVASMIDRVVIMDLARYVRCVWTLSGGTATFDLPGQAHAVYSGRGDSRLPAHLLERIDPDRVADEMIKASSVAADRVGVAYQLPLAFWGPGLTAYTADIADCNLLHLAGYDPDSLDAEVYRLRSIAAMKALDQVARGTVQLDGALDDTPGTEEASAFVASASSRGWFD